MIVNVDENTLNKKGEKISSSKLQVRCDHVNENGNQCEKEWSSIYGNYTRKKGDKDYCRSHNNSLGISGIKGRGHPEEYKKKLSERMKTTNPMHSKKSRRKVSEALKNKYKFEAHHMLGKKRPEHAEFMKEFMEAVMDPDNDFHDDLRCKLLFDKRRLSKLHKSVKASLEIAGYSEFLTEQMVGGYLVDELWEEEKIVLEIHGSIWHMNPRIYAADDLVPLKGAKKTAQDVWDRDAKKKKHIEDLGYKVIYIWDDQFNGGNFQDFPWEQILGVKPKQKQL